MPSVPLTIRDLFPNYQESPGGMASMVDSLKGVAQGAAPAAAAAAAGAGVLQSGLGDLKNNNLLVSYGAHADMGQGHKSPADQLIKMIDSIKETAPEGSFWKKIQTVRAPVLDYEGSLAPEVEASIKQKGKFLTGMDTGWGMLDPERHHLGVPRKGLSQRVSYLRDRILGNKFMQRDPLFMRRFENFFRYNPDGRSEHTGYSAAGDANRIAPLRNDMMVAYGDFNPMVANHKSRGKLVNAGRAAPLVELAGLDKVLDRPQYSKLVADYLTRAGYQGITPESVMGKKIITVSGATRGDTVGARTAWAADQLAQAGKNLDDYLILGIGAKGIDRERMLASASPHADKIKIGPLLGSPREFVNMANNSDLHLLGMGGSTPPEMLAHGGAPLAVIRDEQVFRTAGPESWSDVVELYRDRGIHGLENKLRERVNAKLPSAQHLTESPGRDWMNLAEHDGKMVRRGLDGIRDYMDLRGIRELDSGTPGALAGLMDDQTYMNKARLEGGARLVRGDIQDSADVLRKILKARITKARSAARIRGGAKGVLGAAALVPMALQLHEQMRKKAAEDPRAELAAAGAAAGTSGLLYDTARSFEKVAPISNPYRTAVRDYLARYPQEAHTGFEPQRHRDFLKVMDTYADATKKMLGLRVGGVPAHVMAKRLPIASLLTDKRNTILHALGLSKFIPDANLWSVMDSAAHYRDAYLDPRAAFSREMLTDGASEVWRPNQNAASLMDAGEIRNIVEAPPEKSLVDRFSGFIDKAQRDGHAGSWSHGEVFGPREIRMIRGADPKDTVGARWLDDLPSIQARAEQSGISSYGRIFENFSKKVSPRLRKGSAIMAAAAALLGARGLYNMRPPAPKGATVDTLLRKFQP